MTYFEYLMKTAEADGPEIYAKYLVEDAGTPRGTQKAWLTSSTKVPKMLCRVKNLASREHWGCHVYFLKEFLRV